MANPQIYSMKWNNYQNHIGGIFVELLESETLVDLTLCAEGERISCHRIILSACSPYFKEILTDIKSSHAVVILCGISAADTRAIIEFVYKGELKIRNERLTSFLKAAEALKITGLMEVSSHLPILQIVNVNEGLEEEVQEQNVEQVMNIKEEPQFYTEEEAAVLGSNMEIVSSNIEYEVDSSNVEQVLEYTNIEEDFKESNFTIIPDENEDQSNLSIETSTVVPENRKKRRREFSKKDYSEDAVAAAIDDLVQGHSLLETANTHRIPRSTLYARARSYGISPRITRHEYSEEKITAAVQTVQAGASLQTASVMYNIPKTVLWRRVQKDIGSYALSIRAKLKQRYLPHAKEAAIRALEKGEKINKVAMQYKIPKTTLFREKSRLVEAGKLPKSCLNRRVPNNDSYKQIRLTQAVAACKEGRMSQSAASSAFKVSKTTIWRRLQQCGANKPAKFFKPKMNSEDRGLDFKQVVSEISESYNEGQEYPEASFIILAPNSCGGEIEFKSADQIVMDSVMMADNVEDVGEIIEIQETPTNCEEFIQVEEIS